jgi:pimeloyl-ACP methyl ester carboxylesterase
VARNIGVTYGADPTQVTLVGHSYGGWPAAVVALTPTPFTPPTGSCNTTSGSLRPDAFVGLDGLYIEVQNHAAYPIQLLTPSVYADEASRAAALAAEDPYALAKQYPAGPGSTTIRLLYGALDQTADLAWSQSLDAALAAAGYGSTLHLVPGADHMGVLTAPETIAAILAVAKGK